MTTTYEKCDGATNQLLQQLIGKYHSPIKEAEVTFDLVFAAKEDKEGNSLPAVKLHGVAASAKVKITSLEDRARGVADVKIVIDRYQWEVAKPETRAAILDHELTHVMLKDEGEPDDLGRPKLKLKEHDWMVWGFDSIVERYKEFAPDYIAFYDAADHFRQLSLFKDLPETFNDAIKKRSGPGSNFDKAMRKDKTGVTLTDTATGEVLYHKPEEA
jgi:hypothetical protein